MLRLYCHLVIWWGWWNWKCQTLLVLYCVRLHTTESLRSLTDYEYEYESMTVSVSQCLSHTVNVSVPVYVVTTSLYMPVCFSLLFLSASCCLCTLCVSLVSLSRTLSPPPLSLKFWALMFWVLSSLPVTGLSVCLSLSTSPWIPPWVFLSQSHPTNCLHMCMVHQHMYTCMHTCMHTQWCTQWDAHTNAHTQTHTHTHCDTDSLCLFLPSVVISVTVSLTSWSWMKFLQILYIMKQQIVLISNVIIVFSNTQQLA